MRDHKNIPCSQQSRSPDPEASCAATSQQRTDVQAWEGEGSAVPISSHRTAAAMTPADYDGAPR
jgi:hypothetical protein